MTKKINPLILSLFGLLFSYLVAFVILYSSFLQIPVFAGKLLVWQSLVEQFTVFVPTVLAFFYLGKVILD